jgi:hypothetical protein
MQMHNSGVDLKTIRATIENRYRARFGEGTPTPPVPAR